MLEFVLCFQVKGKSSLDYVVSLDFSLSKCQKGFWPVFKLLVTAVGFKTVVTNFFGKCDTS